MRSHVIAMVAALIQVSALALGIALGLEPSASATTLLWDNGPRVDNTSDGYCDQGPFGYGGSGTWTYYDNFALGFPAQITSFKYTDWFFSGGPANYVRTNWSLFAGDPHSSSPLASGSAVAILTPVGGPYEFLVTGLSVNLAAGSFWLGINNTVTGDILTSVAEPAFIDGAKQSDGILKFNDTPDRVFSVYGDPVPEPATGFLAIAGLGGLAVGSRKRA